MLTTKHQHFVDEYCIDRNASRAARAAGYSAVSAKVTASRLLTNANVRAAVAIREMEAEQALDMTRGSVLMALQEAFGLARQQRNPNAMIAACREIGRICGFYAPERAIVMLTPSARKDVAGFEAMTDVELMQVITSLE
ncbi:terminase small subunit [Glaciimonas sp. CA11.2]|uniref:terminase small subunit n=1 Tax=Glaciimonas sp. CA11.2 TaxID=3048601 RepID=UPI002AB51BD1|nr:terminase small subunit [Glaciimonas sp. CA11.2]MDY7546746.1 terminase small subunit [Glaciimonas sp. CA11.2]MEB0164191.1 terminase small subunit [Glaciimonas sp. CA11.2]